MSVVVDLNKMAGNNVDSFIQSVQYTSDMVNGSFIALGALVTGQNDVRVAATPSDVTAEEVLLVASPEIIKATVNGIVLNIELSDRTAFTNIANKPARAYRLKVGDQFTMTDAGISGTTVVGQYVIPQNGSFTPVASAVIGSTIISLKVLAKTYITNGVTKSAATVLEVVKSR